MAKTRKSELKNLSIEEYVKKLAELKLELMKLRAQVSRGTPPENPGMIRAIRRNIARILTFKNQKLKGSVQEK